jgi:hypothetical protein
MSFDEQAAMVADTTATDLPTARLEAALLNRLKVSVLQSEMETALASGRFPRAESLLRALPGRLGAWSSDAAGAQKRLQGDLAASQSLKVLDATASTEAGAAVVDSIIGQEITPVRRGLFFIFFVFLFFFLIFFGHNGVPIIFKVFFFFFCSLWCSSMRMHM